MVLSVCEAFAFGPRSTLGKRSFRGQQQEATRDASPKAPSYLRGHPRWRPSQLLSPSAEESTAEAFEAAIKFVEQRKKALLNDMGRFLSVQATAYVCARTA